MTKEETRKILAVLKAEYGNKVEMSESRVNLWHLILGHAAFLETELAVASLLSLGGQWPPSVGEVNQAVLEGRSGAKADWGTLWDRVMAAAQRSAYYAVEEAEKLPPDALAAIGGIPGLKELAAGTADQIGVIRGQFRQRLEARKQHDHYHAANTALQIALPQIRVKAIG